MAKYDRVAKRAAESLLEDERLRSNLTDEEAKILLDWALEWLSAQIKKARSESAATQVAKTELGRVRQVIGAVNALAKTASPMTLSQAIAAVEPQLQDGKPFSPDEVLTLVTLLANEVWLARAGKTRK